VRVPWTKPNTRSTIWEFEALVFFGALGALVGLLLLGFSAFKAVTGALVLILVLAAMRPRTESGPVARACWR
jgi:hypothetical protein